MSSINNTLSSSYLQSILSNSLQDTAPISGQNNNAAKASGTSITQPADSGQLSPLSQLMSTLQQLQQSDPAKYAQVTGQIATNLESAAQAAQANGNTSAATQLNALATDFSKASSTGQLPDIKDLAQAVGGHHGHHGHHAHAAPSTDSDGSTDTTSTDPFATTSATTNTPLNQFLASLQSTGGGNGGSGSQHDSLNAGAIISSTLANAGL